MIERSERLIVLADGSKLGSRTMAAVAPASTIDTLVTDASAPADELEALRALGVTVDVISRATPIDRQGRPGGPDGPDGPDLPHAPDGQTSQTSQASKTGKTGTPRTTFSARRTSDAGPAHDLWR